MQFQGSNSNGKVSSKTGNRISLHTNSIGDPRSNIFSHLHRSQGTVLCRLGLSSFWEWHHTHSCPLLIRVHMTRSSSLLTATMEHNLNEQ
jgi:hypothetical protein